MFSLNKLKLLVTGAIFLFVIFGYHEYSKNKTIAALQGNQSVLENSVAVLTSAITPEETLGLGVVSGYDRQLADSIAATDATIPVSSLADRQGNVITVSTSTTGDAVYFTLEPGTSREEYIRCTNNDGVTNWGGCLRGLPSGATGCNNVTSSTLQQAHNAGSRIIMSNVCQVYNELVAKDTNQILRGALTVSSSATSTFASGLQASVLNITTSTVTSTFRNGIQLTGGCILSANGTCLGGANAANSDLSNLTATMINLSLNPASDNAIDLGRNDLRWRNIFVGTTLNVSSSIRLSNFLTIGQSVSSTSGTLYLDSGGNINTSGTLALNSTSSYFTIGRAEPNASGTLWIDAGGNISTSGTLILPNVFSLDRSGNITTSGTLRGQSTGTSTLLGGLISTQLNINGTAGSSTFRNGISLTGGCFLMADGYCAGASGGALATTTSTLFGTYSSSTFTVAILSSTSSIIIGQTSNLDTFASGTLYLSRDGSFSASSSITTFGGLFSGLDNVIDIGTVARRFKSLFLGGSVHTSSTVVVGTSGTVNTSTFYGAINDTYQIAVKGFNLSTSTPKYPFAMPFNAATGTYSINRWNMAEPCIIVEARMNVTSTNASAYRTIVDIEMAPVGTTNFNTIFSSAVRQLDLGANQRVTTTPAWAFATTSISAGDEFRLKLLQRDEKDDINVQLLCR